VGEVSTDKYQVTRKYQVVKDEMIKSLSPLILSLSKDSSPSTGVDEGEGENC
jgi:hypothetical protein